jgi:N-methylhydantoinase A
MLSQANSEIQSEGFSADTIQLEPSLDLRYQGQSYELNVKYAETFLEDFHEIHFQTYGYRRTEAQIEIVNLRVRAIGAVSTPNITTQPKGDPDPSEALFDRRPICLADGWVEVPLFQGERLKPGNRVPGPAIIVRSDTTILIGPKDQAHVDPFSNLLIQIGQEK